MTQPPTAHGAAATEGGDAWFLRLDALHVRGPIGLATLREWAERGALSPLEEVSRDGHHWQRAHTIPDLDMVWEADLAGGQTYGPFNILAARHLTERGILKPDSVLRRVEAATTAAGTPAAEAAPAAVSADAPRNTPGVTDRVVHIEHELRTLRRDLASLQRAPVYAPGPSARPLAASTPDATSVAAGRVAEKIHRTEALLQQLVQERSETGESRDGWSHQQSAAQRGPLGSSPVQATRQDLASLHEDGYVIWKPEDVRELARVRRFTVSTLRWNVINSSLVIGTGVTVGALGVILEQEPVHYTGLVLSVMGLLYFAAVMLMMLAQKLPTWISVAMPHEEGAEPLDGHPVRGVLSITIYWLNRKFRPRPPQA
jgi:hypothetical protein